VDHPYAAQVPRSWRTATLVAAALAALELVLLVLVAIAFLGKELTPRLEAAATHEITAPVVKPKPRVIPAGTPKLTREQTSVTVLNANGQSGAAGYAAESVRRRGYAVATVGNAPSTTTGRTAVMFRPGYRPEALRLAKDLRVKVVGPLDGLTVRDLMGAHVVLVLGR
jgi:hypothetical protein